MHTSGRSRSINGALVPEKMAPQLFRAAALAASHSSIFNIMLQQKTEKYTQGNRQDLSKCRWAYYMASDGQVCRFKGLTMEGIGYKGTARISQDELDDGLKAYEKLVKLTRTTHEAHSFEGLSSEARKAEYEAALGKLTRFALLVIVVHPPPCPIAPLCRVAHAASHVAYKRPGVRICSAASGFVRTRNTYADICVKHSQLRECHARRLSSSIYATSGAS